MRNKGITYQGVWSNKIRWINQLDLDAKNDWVICL